MTTTTDPAADPAADRPLFPAITDQRIARLRRALRTAEIQTDMLREMLDDQIAVRHRVTASGQHVCVVCGTVTTATPHGTIDAHPDHSHRRGRQCRGTGLPVTSPPIGGGL